MTTGGLQGDEGIYYCIHGTRPYHVCVQCIQERRDREAHEMLRESHEMLRESFDRLTAVLIKLEAKL